MCRAHRALHKLPGACSWQPGPSLLDPSAEPPRASAFTFPIYQKIPREVDSSASFPLSVEEQRVAPAGTAAFYFPSARTVPAAYLL